MIHFAASLGGVLHFFVQLGGVLGNAIHTLIDTPIPTIH